VRKSNKSQQLEGTATVSSTFGAGTCVSLLLPRAPPLAMVASPARMPRAKAPPDVRPNGARLLVIDDEPDVREVAVDSLFTLGFDVVEAESSWAGLKILGGDLRVDLVVVDFAMPEMNGLELIRRARLSHPNLPCLLVTGYAEVAELDAESSSGISILRKPYRINDLATAVGDLLAAIQRAGRTIELA
jgi:CheY-like chemotaxis protein